jgi:hypothetical protein
MTSFSYADVSLDDLLLGIGGILLVATFAMATIVVNLAQELEDAEAAYNLEYLIEHGPQVVRMWYATAAIYLFSVVFPGYTRKLT